MKAKVIKKFYDKIEKKIREVGSEFETTETRIQELEAKGYVEIVGKNKKTDKE